MLLRHLVPLCIVSCLMHCPLLGKVLPNSRKERVNIKHSSEFRLEPASVLVKAGLQMLLVLRLDALLSVGVKRLLESDFSASAHSFSSRSSSSGPEATSLLSTLALLPASQHILMANVNRCGQDYCSQKDESNNFGGD